MKKNNFTLEELRQEKIRRLKREQLRRSAQTSLKDFICIAEKEKISLMRSSNRTTKTEKLFIPKHQYQMYLGE